MTIWDCRTHVRMTSMMSSVERTDLDFKISVALLVSLSSLFFFPRQMHFNFIGKAVVSYWQKNMHYVLVNCLGGLPRNSVNSLTDRARNDLKSVKGL